MRRGEVWWADLGPPAGRRPVVLLSRDEAYTIRTLVTIAPVTTRIRGIPAELELGPEDNLPRPSAANLDAITTVPKSCITERVSLLSLEKRRDLDRAIHFALGLES